MICSTSLRQRGVRLLLLVAGAVLACVSLYFFRAFVCLFVFAFYGVLCGNCNWSILSFFFFNFFSFFPCLLLFCGKLWRLFFSFLNNLFYITIIIIIINANNDRFAVLCNRYFSACDWRFIWCQFVADVKENPGGFPVTVKYRRPYASTVVTDSILCIVAAIWRGCRKFESCT